MLGMISFFPYIIYNNIEENGRRNNSIMKNQKKFLESYHLLKFIELIMLIIIEIICFCIIYNDKRLRTAVFSNPVLFRLSCMLWLLLIFSFVFLIIDFRLLQKAVNDNYDLNKTAYLDKLTGIPNRNSVDMLIESNSDTSSVFCIIFRISNIDDVNHTKGHEAGDQLIRDFCNILQRISRSYGFAARNGGNDFIAILDPCDSVRMNRFMDEINSEISLYNDEHENTPILIDSAYSSGESASSEPLTDLIAETVHKMHEIR